MKITPYQTIYGDHVTYRCKAVLDDGRVFDLKGAKDTDWAALAEIVSAPMPEPVDPVEEIREELEQAQAELAQTQTDVAELAAVLKVDAAKTDLNGMTKILETVMKEKAVADAITAAKPIAIEEPIGEVTR